MLAKTNHLKKLAPVVNGILRSALRNKERGSLLPKSNSPSLELAKSESIPLWLADELISWKGVKDANKIAHVLIDDCGLIPGNRGLLRAPNSYMLAACWYGVVKAGGGAV